MSHLCKAWTYHASEHGTPSSAFNTQMRGAHKATKKAKSRKQCIESCLLINKCVRGGVQFFDSRLTGDGAAIVGDFADVKV